MRTTRTRQEVTSAKEKRGQYWLTHEVCMDEVDSTVWLNDAIQLVCGLRQTAGDEGQVDQLSDVQLRFKDGGEESELFIWNKQTETYVGYLSGGELVAFLYRALLRARRWTPSNSPSMTKAGHISVEHFEKFPKMREMRENLQRQDALQQAKASGALA